MVARIIATLMAVTNAIVARQITRILGNTRRYSRHIDTLIRPLIRV